MAHRDSLDCIKERGREREREGERGREREIEGERERDYFLNSPSI